MLFTVLFTKKHVLSKSLLDSSFLQWFLLSMFLVSIFTSEQDDSIRSFDAWNHCKSNPCSYVLEKSKPYNSRNEFESVASPIWHTELQCTRFARARCNEVFYKYAYQQCLLAQLVPTRQTINNNFYEPNQTPWYVEAEIARS